MAFSLSIVPALALACQAVLARGSLSSLGKSGALSIRAPEYRHPVRLQRYTGEKMAGARPLTIAYELPSQVSWKCIRAVVGFKVGG